MARIIGVKFRNAGKLYYFNPKDMDIKYNDHVVVETARGLEYGTVIISAMELADEKIKQPLRDVVRMATEEDTAKEREHIEKEHEAYRICQEKIRERNLEMKLIAAEYTFDDTKLLFYFTADGRIDFRELVKDLAGVFRKRIELRQIGVRDETKVLGGIGICGRPLCCHTYLNNFAPVSIRMAKEQNLSLNPTKISGTCGRLMCCLRNEADTYAALSKNLPGKGDQVTTPDGRHGEVQSVNILRQLVKVVVDTDDDERELIEYPVEEITFIPHSKRPKNQPKKGAESKEASKEEKSPEQKKLQKAVQKVLENQQAEQAEREMWAENLKKEQRRKKGTAQRRKPAAHEKSAENAPAAEAAGAAPEAAKRSRNRRRRRPSRQGGQADGAGQSNSGQANKGGQSNPSGQAKKPGAEA